MVCSRSTSCLWMLILGLGFYINYASAQNAEGADCQTPNEISGKCIGLMECQPMLKVVSSLRRPFSSKISKQLNAYRCELDGGSVKVCCPPGPILLDSDNTIPVQNRTEPPDVTNHKNINILPQTCGHLDTSKRIVNGENAYLNEFPWMALLQYKSAKGMKYLCGGTIIHKNYILTAAHCLSELKSGQGLVAVRVGEHSIKNETDCEIQDDKKKSLKCNPPVQDLKVEEIIPHPEFGGKKGHVINDIGLVRVSTINLEVENARPVCLPIGIVRDNPFRNVIVTGWGVSDVRTGASSDILQKVGLPVANKAECIKAYNEANIPLTNTQICAGGKSDKDSCSGDSGGPMMVPTLLGEDNFVYIQQGIVSYGPKYCGVTGYPGVYTMVKFYMDWILDTMKP